MKETKYKIALAVFGAVAALSGFTAQGAGDLRRESEEAVANFLKVDSNLKTFADQSAGYAVFPNVGKGGLIVGGAHGDGLVYDARHREGVPA